MVSIHFFVILLAALAAFILGFMAHGPLLGKVWMKLADIHPTGNEKLSDMVPQMAWNFVANIVCATGLAIVYLFAAHSGLLTGSTALNGIICGLIVWLGFTVSSSSIGVIWMGQSAKLWLFESACSMVVFAVMGVIIATI
ncbi:MAG: DUF1761 domain-containing protein [Candidatus Paceibacterota bacterium]